MLGTIYIANAQPALRGIVVDSNNHALAGVSVQLQLSEKGKPAKSMLTDDKGFFHFEDVQATTVQLHFSHIGFKSYDTILNSTTSLSAISIHIKLDAEEKYLQLVSIAGRKPLMERKIDRTVFNVEAMPSSMGSNALEIFEQIPGIVIDDRGAIMLKGKTGVTVYIDDRPTYLSGLELANYLKSLSGTTIEKIEIMPNPPAQYNAEGSGGVINIKLKKIRARGWNGNLSASLGKGVHWRSDESAMVNYRNDRWNIFTNLGYSLFNNFFISIRDRNFLGDGDSILKSLHQHIYEKNTDQNYSAKLVIDYKLSSRSTLGISYNASVRDYIEHGQYNSQFFSPDKTLDSLMQVTSQLTNPWSNQSANLHFRQELGGSGEVLTMDADYVGYDSKKQQDLLTTFSLPDSTLISSSGTLTLQPYTIHIYSARADYSMDLKNKFKLESGLKSSFSSIHNDARYYFKTDSVDKPDYNHSNEFSYRENIYAGYLNAHREGKKLDAQFGLRIETTDARGYLAPNPSKKDSSFHNFYTDFFPTLYLLFKADSSARNQISFTYGRRIDRPYYEDLNPSVFIFDRYFIYAGNRLLKPAYSDNFELSHIFLQKITTSFSYSAIRNLMMQTYQQFGDTIISQPVNIAHGRNISVNVNVSWPVCDWYTANGYAEFEYDEYRGALAQGNELHTSLSTWRGSFNNQFKFSNGWSADLAGYFRTKTLFAQVISYGAWYMNAAVQKKFAQGKWVIGLSGKDIFYSRRLIRDLNEVKNTTMHTVNRSDTRWVGIQLSYKFGNVRNAGPENKDRVQDDMNRIRTN